MTSRRLLTETARALLSGADYLEAHQHCKGAFEKFGAVCAIGAISKATDDSHVLDDATLALAKHLGKRSIAAWNDRPERTKDEVVAALRAAAVTTAHDVDGTSLRENPSREVRF